MKKHLKSIIIVSVFLLGLFLYDHFSKDETVIQAQDNRNHLYGFWVSQDSFIVISNGESKEGEMNLREYVQNVSEKNHGLFKITSSKDNNYFEAEFLKSEKEFTLELNEDKDELTLSNGSKVSTFKFTETSPSDYVANYNQ